MAYKPTVDLQYDGVVAGAFAQAPLGVILHGSRSGAVSNTTAQEYLGTARYTVNNPGGLGWHATIGDDQIALHMEYSQWGWSAREHSFAYLAVEFAQATEAQPISDAQVRAFCWFVQQARSVWPNLPLEFPTHAELPAGVRDGKSDVFSRNSPRADELRARISAQLDALNAPEPQALEVKPIPRVRKGVNVDALNQPRDPAQLKAEGFDGVRLVMHDDDQCRAYAQNARAEGLVVLGVQASETGGYMLPTELVDVVQIGNEPDSSGDSSWTRSVEDYAADLRIYRGTYPDHCLIAAGLSSGQPDYLRQVVATGALEGYSAIAVHPYAKTADEARQLLTEYRQLTNLPTVVSEWNRPADEVRDFETMVRTETQQAYWFADGDWMVPGFGLIDSDGQAKPEYLTLVDQPVLLLNERDALRTQVTGLTANLDAATAAVNTLRDQLEQVKKSAKDVPGLLAENGALNTRIFSLKSKITRAQKELAA